MNEGTFYLIVFLAVYFILLSIIALRSRAKTSGVVDYFQSTFSPFILALTFAATLYSAFFMIGVPGFLFTHGIGAWPYVILGDVAGVLVLYIVGRRVIEIGQTKPSKPTSTIQLIGAENDKPLIIVFVVTVSSFMIPYLALQILGMGRLLSSVSESGISPILGAGLVLMFIWIYSSIGGIRAIVLSDAIQGIILFSLLFGLGVFVWKDAGGIGLFDTLAINNPKHLSLPGPEGFFTFSTLLSFFIVIALLPISQPQFLSRYILFLNKEPNLSVRKLKRVSIGMCVIFSIVSLPIIIIGLGGAANYSGEVVGDDIVSHLLSTLTPSWFASLFSVAVLAAAMSTTDSILFSIAQMLSQDVLSGSRASETNKLIQARLFVLGIAILAFFFALLSSSPLILTLGKLAFSGCVVVVPFLYFGLFEGSQKNILRLALYIPVSTYAMLIFLDYKNFAGIDVAIWSSVLGFLIALFADRFFWKSKYGSDT